MLLITFPDADVARELSGSLVEEGLVACVNLVGGVESIYRWDGALQRDSEVLGIAKVRRDRIEEVSRVVIERHPYDVPEVIALPVAGGNPAYLEWVAGA